MKKEGLNIIYDEIIGKQRTIIAVDRFNFIVIEGPEAIDYKELTSKGKYRNYYTSIHSLITATYTKRVKTHFSDFTLMEMQKALQSAYKDVITLSNGIDNIAKQLIKRT
tara:strand:- start:645 stop:971 length:327 start_codon:yes stop_codon:yes gene_type:complete